MGATITFTWTLDTTGKSLTGVPGGGYSGAGLAVTNANGIQTHVTGPIYVVPASVSVVGGNLVVVLASAYLTGTTVQADITAANTITDGAANTGQVATNTAVTNNSTVTGATTNCVTNLTKFNFNGALAIASSALTDLNGMVSGVSTADNTGYSMEFVINVTAGTVDVDYEGYVNTGVTLYFQVDGAAQQTKTGSGLGYEWLKMGSALGVGKHVIRHNCPNNFYTRAIRLSGGTATIVTIQCPVAIFKDNVANLSVTSATSPVKIWGTQKNASNYINNSHGGLNWNVSGSFQGLDILGLTGAGVGISIATAADAGTVPAAVSAYSLLSIADPGAGLRNAYQMCPAFIGLSAGAHTVEVLDTAMLGFQAVRAWNGSKLSSAASISDPTISVADITNIADGDWLCLDHLNKEEIVKVSSHSGSGPYTLTLASTLAKAHASGVAVRNFTPTNTPTLTAGTTPTFAGRLVAVGDSITAAEAIDTAGTVPATGYTNYEPRASYALMAARAANFECVLAATQGWVASQVATDNAPTVYDPRKPATIYTIKVGTNDFGSAETLIATYQTQYGIIISNAKTAAPSGAKILGIKFVSPTNKTVTVNQGGKTKADYNAAAAAALVAAAAAGFTLTQVDICRSLSKVVANADIPDSTHFSISGTTIGGSGGQNKAANELVPHLLPVVISGGASTATVNSPTAAFTLTLPGGATFTGLDTVTITASNGTVHATTAGGSISGQDSGAVTITPPAGATAFTYTSTSTAGGTTTLTKTNGQGWTDAAVDSITVTAPATTLSNNRKGARLYVVVPRRTVRRRR